MSKKRSAAAALDGKEQPAKRARVMRSTVEENGLRYMVGMENEFATEAIDGALPQGQNNPQKCPHGLYAEQLSGTAFTVPRKSNRRSWLYRIEPGVKHSRLEPVDHPGIVNDFAGEKIDPNQMRWQPPAIPDEPTDFVQGLKTMAGAGSPISKSGMAIYYYVANRSMGDKCLYNSDGDFLIVPQEGALDITTELGKLHVAPHEICVVQRGIHFSVDVGGPSRGYICEIFAGHFELPNLGPIGANGLANPRDFCTPVAWYEDREAEFEVVNKFGGNVFRATRSRSPYNVVGWHGNYAPYKYNLDNFVTMNSVSVDHPDPSIYTVLTCQTDTPGVALCDFVIFPPRWMVMDHSFRPPYYHRNCMTEFMGMVHGSYDAKKGFVPGGSSLHSCMTPHGPDADTFYAASTAELKPEYFSGGLAFMFETTLMLHVTDYAKSGPHREQDYQECWTGLPKMFDPSKRDVDVPRPAAGAGHS